MNSIDVLCLIVIGFNLILGAIRGAVWQVLRIASIGLGIWGAFRYSEDFLAMFPPSLGLSESYGLIVSQVVLFLSIYLVMFGVTHLVRAFVEKLKLGSMDRLIGAGLGVAKGALFCCVALYLQFVPLIGDMSVLKDQLHGDPAADRPGSVANRVFLAHLKERIDAAVPASITDSVDEGIERMSDELTEQGR